MRTSQECFESFLALKQEVSGYPLATQTEADTRARIISKLLEDALDWPPQNVNREENAHPGFMDYVLLTNKRALVIEAKKSGDTFKLPLDITSASRFTLNGIIRTVKNLKHHIDQVLNYCFNNGIEYAAVSNGLQFVIFRAVRTDGIHIGQGRIIVFEGLDDIENRFTEFWNLLSKQGVENGSLQRAFLQLDSSLSQYKRVADEVHSYRERVSRNALATGIEPLIGEYMGEIAGDVNEKLKNCFVKNAALSDVLDAVSNRISLHLSGTIAGAGAISQPNRTDKLKGSLRQTIESHVKLPPRGQVLVLLGRVGSGKTTFTSHFLQIELKELFKTHILVNFDFRNLEKGGDVPKFFYDHLHEQLSRNQVFLSLSPKELREAYSPEIRQLATGPLAVVERQNKKLFEQKIAEYLMERYIDRENHYMRILQYLATRKRVRCVFVFDNADQHDFELQQDVFRFAHSVTNRCNAFSIVNMWEETYFRSKQSGALAAYQPIAYTLPPTSVVAILDRRLDYVLAEITKGGLAAALISGCEYRNDIPEFLSIVRRSILHQNHRVRFFLESIALGNLRKAMDVFSQFLTSGHTDASKILATLRSHNGYLVPLHEFVKSIGLGDYRYYHSDLSSVMNLYAISDESRPSHFTKIRLLHYLHHHRSHSSGFGVGFARTLTLQEEFERIGTSKTDIHESLSLLSKYALVENDIYNAREIGKAYRITPAGRYYLRYLAVRFPYLDLVLQDTPMSDHLAFITISALLESRDIDDKFKRVETFLNYLLSEEDREYAVVIATSESMALRRKLLAEMLPEFQSEKHYISQKAKKQRKTTDATPYSSR